eukprot:5079249-Pleurochrysis_carterae.AAC.2
MDGYHHRAQHCISEFSFGIAPPKLPGENNFFPTERERQRESTSRESYFTNGETKSNLETLKTLIAFACEKARPQMQRDAVTLLNLPAKVASPRLQLTQF